MPYPEHTKDKARRIIEMILAGSSLKLALAETGLTSGTLHRIMCEDRELSAAYSRAVEVKADLLADQVIELADGEGDPNKVRNQINARQWLASKLNKRYSDRIDLNVTQTIDVSATLAEARARLLRPVSDHLEHNPSQVIDLQPQLFTKPSDVQSVSGPPASDSEPDPIDIFS
jgi:hypothetical protein